MLCVLTGVLRIDCIGCLMLAFEKTMSELAWDVVQRIGLSSGILP